MNFIILAILGAVVWAALGVRNAVRAGYSTSKGWEYNSTFAREAMLSGPFFNPTPRG